MSDANTIAGRFIALLVGTLIVIVIAEVALRFIFPNWREFYSGWFMTPVDVAEHGRIAIGKPGFDGYFAQNNGDFRVRVRINRAGLRNDEQLDAAQGRLWVIGDSMAFGWGVERDQTYTALIARNTGRAAYNVASPGTDVCGYQALAGRMPESLRPAAVIVGLILENDIANYDCEAKAKRDAAKKDGESNSSTMPASLAEVKRTLTRVSALYNFLAVALKRVNVVHAFLVKIGVIKQAHNDHAAPSKKKHDQLIARTAAELLRLRRMFSGIPFAVLIAPARYEIRDGDQNYSALRTGIGSALRTRSIDVIDPINSFKKQGLSPTHFRHDGHWSPLGHRLAADAVSVWINTLTYSGDPRARGESAQ